MTHKIVHWEIMGPDGAALRSFYEDMFGWAAEAVPGFDAYFITDADKSGVEGAIGQGMEGMSTYMTMYVEVDNVDEHLSKAEGAGGSTIVPRTVVPDVVTFGLFSDPAGNMVGVVERETQPAE